MTTGRLSNLSLTQKLEWARENNMASMYFYMDAKDQDAHAQIEMGIRESAVRSDDNRFTLERVGRSIISHSENYAYEIYERIPGKVIPGIY
jgi:hypothetical protein